MAIFQSSATMLYLLAPNVKLYTKIYNKIAAAFLIFTKVSMQKFKQT